MKRIILLFILMMSVVIGYSQVQLHQLEPSDGSAIFPVGNGASNRQIYRSVNDVKTLLGIPTSGAVYTDDQNITGSSLVGTALTIGIENGSSQVINFTGWDTDASDDFDGAWGSLTGIPADIADGDDNTQLSQEQVQDFVGPMVTGNTETLISVTYDDASNEFDFVVEDDLSLYDNTTSGFLTSEVDGSITNEAQTLSTSGATDPTIDLSAANAAGGGSVTVAGGANIDVTQAGGTITIAATTAEESTTVTDGNTIDFTLAGTDITGEVILDPAGNNIASSSASGLLVTDDLSQYDNSTSAFITLGDLNDNSATNELQDIDAISGTNIDDGSLSLTSSAVNVNFETEQFTGGPFTLANTPIFIISVHRNGVYQELTDDYTVAGSTLTLASGAAFGVGEELTVVYVYE